VSRWALVPLKARAHGKRRLAAVLDDSARMALVVRMFAHVLTVLRNVAELDGIAVLTPDGDALPPDVLHLHDDGAELNQALSAALTTLSARGVTRAVVIAADLPRLAAAEVAALIAASAAGGIALAPDRHGTGTNALALALPSSLPLQFGVGSFERHLEAAARLVRSPAVVRLPGLACDVDEPQDLEFLALP
jgi:2-phospho-L-lactate/phosphoenolpyruvate guanylyltransferase